MTASAHDTENILPGLPLIVKTLYNVQFPDANGPIGKAFKMYRVNMHSYILNITDVSEQPQWDVRRYYNVVALRSTHTHV